MTDKLGSAMIQKYGSLGGKHNLQLALGAHGFWENRRDSTYGFSFYSAPKEVYFHVKLNPENSGLHFYIVVSFRYGIYKQIYKFDPLSLTVYNKFKWYDVTATRLELFS
jgi:hypothetical protein